VPSKRKGLPAFHLLLSVHCSKTLSTPSRQLQVSTAQQAPPFDVAQLPTPCPAPPRRVQQSTICSSPTPTQGVPTRHRYSQAWPGTAKVIIPGRCSALGLEHSTSSDPPDNDRRHRTAIVGPCHTRKHRRLSILRVTPHPRCRAHISGQTPFLVLRTSGLGLLDCE